MATNSLCQSAKDSAKRLALLSQSDKNSMLDIVAEALILSADKILNANVADIKDAKADNKPQHFIDRLSLNNKRIQAMAEGIRELIKLPDPVGVVLDSFTNHCGLEIQKVSVPLGVIGIIYEARPNVTADAVGLCLKSGNAVVLRGSKDAINSNIAIVKAIKDALKAANYDSECIQLITDTDRKSATELMHANGLVDVLIPRGGKGLIQSVVKNSTVPVIETGAGNCHVYVEKTADMAMAKDILINAKVSRPSVCNAAETLLIDSAAAEKYLAGLCGELAEQGVKIRGCEKTTALYSGAEKATEEDFYTEYNDYIIAVKVVEKVQQAIDHINKYSTGHSDAIVTSSAEAAEKFLNEVDSAAVYVNASTRFTDGFEFGFGAEMGISTQKLHARGPMGLKELTSYKYKVKGKGQVRK